MRNYHAGRPVFERSGKYLPRVYEGRIKRPDGHDTRAIRRQPLSSDKQRTYSFFGTNESQVWQYILGCRKQQAFTHKARLCPLWASTLS